MRRRMAGGQPVPANHNGPFTVGDWQVEPDLDRISRGAGTKYLRPQVMELLVHLTRHHDRVVSAEELVDGLWAGKVVTSGTVYNCVGELRNALNHGAAGQFYIETIPKKGYRLVAPVTGLDNPVDSTAEARTAADAGGGVTARYGKAALGAAALIAVIAVIAAALLATGLIPSISPFDDARPDRPLRRFTIELPERVQPGSIAYRPPIISADGRRVTFGAALDGKEMLFSRAIDSLVAEPIPGTEEAWRAHALSPDGETVAFVDATDGRLKKVPIGGGVPVTLCDTAGVVSNLAWAATGDIVFVADSYPGLLRVSASGGVPEALTTP